MIGARPSSAIPVVCLRVDTPGIAQDVSARTLALAIDASAVAAVYAPIIGAGFDAVTAGAAKSCAAVIHTCQRVNA